MPELALQAGLCYNEDRNMVVAWDVGSITKPRYKIGACTMNTPISHRHDDVQEAVCINCHLLKSKSDLYLILSDIIICHDCHQIGRHCCRCHKFFTYEELHGRLFCLTCDEIRRNPHSQLSIELIKQTKTVKELSPEEVASRIRLARERLLFTKYSITLAQYEAMLTQQGGVCAICAKPPKNGRNLAVDHCHKTGRIRQLLCQRCNTLLGAANDDIQRLKQAIIYLERHKQ